MVICIHQPSYFPWLGLLDKVCKSDVYMVMDEVQLSDSLYQHRNLFATQDGVPKFLTIPVVKNGYLGKPIRELEIASSDWRSRHLNFIWNAYRRHPFAEQIMPRLSGFYAADYAGLCDAIVASMRMSFEFFGIDTKVIFQSAMDYDRSLRRGELVAALARAAGATCYLSGSGGSAYLEEATFTGGLSLRFNVFQHPVYPQKGIPCFREGLACLDALFNLGMDGARGLIGEAKH
jgi:WbqC-like protein family